MEKSFRIFSGGLKYKTLKTVESEREDFKRDPVWRAPR